MKLKNDLPKLAKKLSKAYGYKVRLVGPYTCPKTGRKRVDVRGAPTHTGLNKTIQLARARLEVLLDRPLRKGETVDHIDNDCTNDSYSNLQLLSHRDNAAKQTEATRRKSAARARTKESRHARSLRSRGELNSAAKLTNKQVKLIRKKFYVERDFETLLEEVPFNSKSLYNCLIGTTYADAGGPLFVFAPRSAGRRKQPLRIIKVVK